MESKRNFSKVNFKKYRVHCKKSGIAIPKWLTPNDFDLVVALLEDSKKLQACKYLVDRSKDMGTSIHSNGVFGLKWSKDHVCDIIEMFEVKEQATFTLSKPITPSNLLHVDEVREVLAPFYALANQVLDNPNLSKDQVIYAYNKAQITMADLRLVVSVIEKMNSALPANWFNNND